jgi:Gram-negative bacterial TonB protein C-terminal
MFHQPPGPATSALHSAACVALLTTGFLVAAHTCAQPQPSNIEPLPPPEYSIRDDYPSVGTNIKRRRVTSPSIPINRRYHELTPEQQAIVRSNYEVIAAGDDPPFPAEGLRPLYKALGEGQRQLLVAGKLVVVATVDSQGDVQTVKVLSSPDKSLTQFVAKVLVATKFKPAVCGGKPCRMDYLLAVNFTLE